MAVCRFAMLLTAGMFALTGCGLGGSEPEAELAAELCEALESGQPIQHRAAISEATAKVEDEDLDESAFYEAVAETCEQEFFAALGVDDGGSVDLDAQQGLAQDVALDLEACGSRSATGTISNDGDGTVRVRIEVRFTDEDDVLLHTGTDTVRGLRSGETGRWEVSFFGDGYDRCNASVDQVSPD